MGEDAEVCAVVLRDLKVVTGRLLGLCVFRFLASPAVADTGLNTPLGAVEAKLTEQRDFVLWWDAQEHKGGNSTVTGLKRLKDFGADRLTVHRWAGGLPALPISSASVDPGC